MEWTKDAHAVPFELRPPATISTGSVSGCVDFYVGPVLVGQAYVEMAVGKPNDRSNATDKPSVLGPVTKVAGRCALNEDHMRGGGVLVLLFEPKYT